MAHASATALSRYTVSPREKLIAQLKAAGWRARGYSTSPETFLQFHKPLSTTFVFVYEAEAHFGDDDPEALHLGVKPFDEALALLLGTN